jgi:hypothetical protein
MQGKVDGAEQVQMTDVRYEPMPKEVKAALAPLLKEFLFLIPTWCHQLTICYKTENPNGSAAECDSSWEYHFAVITFFPDWLDEDESNRRNLFLHEILHVIQAPAVSFVDDLLASVADSSKAMLEKQWTKAQEFVNEDLANVLGVQRRR